MDKQIIDGIDVKKCVYNESGYCTISKKAYCYCCDKPNCHYKNWQRKEQECEELKKYIKHLHNLCGNETDKQYKLKQTLTKIKEICNNNDELKGDFNLVDCDKYKLGKHNLANRILQKISECEGNDEM